MTNKINFNKKLYTSTDKNNYNNNKPYYGEEVKENNTNNQNNKTNNKPTKREITLKDIDNRIVLWYKKTPLDMATLILTLVNFLDINIEEFLETAIEIRKEFKNKKQ